MSKILSEQFFNDTRVLYEDSVDRITGSKVKRLKIFGTAIVCNIPGINGRAYPKKILEAEVKRFNEKMVSVGRGAAELNHPRLTAEGEGKDYSVFEMNLKKTCALIEELYFDGDKLMCKMVVAEDHSAGKDLASLLKIGYVPGYSLRGAGSVVESGKGYYEVDKDYRLITIDVVGNPSFDDKALISYKFESARPTNLKILTESIEHTRADFMYNRSLKLGYGKYDKALIEQVLTYDRNKFLGG